MFCMIESQVTNECEYEFEKKLSSSVVILRFTSACCFRKYRCVDV